MAKCKSNTDMPTRTALGHISEQHKQQSHMITHFPSHKHLSNATCQVNANRNCCRHSQRQTSTNNKMDPNAPPFDTSTLLQCPSIGSKINVESMIRSMYPTQSAWENRKRGFRPSEIIRIVNFKSGEVTEIDRTELHLPRYAKYHDAWYRWCRGVAQSSDEVADIQLLPSPTTSYQNYSRDSNSDAPHLRWNLETAPDEAGRWVFLFADKYWGDQEDSERKKRWIDSVWEDRVEMSKLLPVDTRVLMSEERKELVREGLREKMEALDEKGMVVREDSSVVEHEASIGDAGLDEEVGMREGASKVALSESPTAITTKRILQSYFTQPLTFVKMRITSPILTSPSSQSNPPTEPMATGQKPTSTASRNSPVEATAPNAHTSTESEYELKPDVPFPESRQHILQQAFTMPVFPFRYSDEDEEYDGKIKQWIYDTAKHIFGSVEKGRTRIDIVWPYREDFYDANAQERWQLSCALLNSLDWKRFAVRTPSEDGNECGMETKEVLLIPGSASVIDPIIIIQIDIPNWQPSPLEIERETRTCKITTGLTLYPAQVTFKLPKPMPTSNYIDS
ncbi:hypothetical protein BJ508DRAFT_308206 [Ascobolus immersus RN42]|uniref:Uncharacterized protein n=1 Tax=Ascobolus immersus RN42 TaxID=1160509 RepID=A0A3N4ICX9_ASCIM|nr:hypothetical protein BJ508DRAFT_308206 [Ascobolus immersus RN42]